LCGNWSGEVIYAPNLVDPPDLSFSVSRGEIKNYLSTTFDGYPIQINLSRTALGGNFTYRGQIFDFALRESVSPLMSTDIELREFGWLHCTIGSNVAVRCLHLNRGALMSIMFRKTGFVSSPGGLLKVVHKNWRSLCLIVFFLLVRFAFKRYSAKMKADSEATATLVASEKAEMEKLEHNVAGADQEGKVKTD
jgi:hypothetical protein